MDESLFSWIVTLKTTVLKKKNIIEKSRKYKDPFHLLIPLNTSPYNTSNLPIS